MEGGSVFKALQPKSSYTLTPQDGMYELCSTWCAFLRSLAGFTDTTPVWGGVRCSTLDQVTLLVHTWLQSSAHYQASQEHQTE